MKKEMTSFGALYDFMLAKMDYSFTPMYFKWLTFFIGKDIYRIFTVNDMNDNPTVRFSIYEVVL